MVAGQLQIGGDVSHHTNLYGLCDTWAMPMLAVHHTRVLGGGFICIKSGGVYVSKGGYTNQSPSKKRKALEVDIFQRRTRPYKIGGAHRAFDENQVLKRERNDQSGLYSTAIINAIIIAARSVE